MGDDWGNIAIESVSDTVSDAMFGLDQSGNLIFWNDGASTLFGYCESEATEKSLDDLFDLNDQDREQIDNLLEMTLRDGEIEPPFDSVKIAATTDSGPTVPVELAVAGADTEALLCVAHPIEETANGHTYPEAIDDSVFRRAIEGSSDLIAAADQNERLLFANNRYREFHGVEEPVPGQSLSNVLPVETYSEIQPYFDQVLDGETVHFEMDRIGADGDKHTLDVQYYPLESATGKIHGAVTTMREITELKQRATSLRKSWETYRDIVDGVPHPLTVHDTQGKILEVNEAACRFVGFPETEMLKKNVKDLLGSDQSELFVDRVKSLATEKQFFETRCKTADGTEVPVEIAATRIEYFGSEAILSIARDLSEYKAYKRELEETNARLEEFAAVVSEDLRNPLTVAGGWADMAQETTGLDSLGRVVESLDRMDNVINYTLTLARKGDGLGNLSVIDLSKLVTQCWDNVDTNGAMLENEVELAVRGDPGRIGHLVETMFENCAAISKGELTITVDDLDYRDGFHITHKGQKFPEIERGEPERSAHIGAGEKADCDLMVIQRIAQAHGWRLRLDSPDVGGVTFEFSNVDVVSGEQTG